MLARNRVDRHCKRQKLGTPAHVRRLISLQTEHIIEDTQTYVRQYAAPHLKLGLHVLQLLVADNLDNCLRSCYFKVLGNTLENWKGDIRLSQDDG